MSRRLLITGATGGLGMALVREALSRGHTVKVNYTYKTGLGPYLSKIIDGDAINNSSEQPCLAPHKP